MNVQIVNSANNQAIGTASLMVRVRKNANTLSTAERNRLLAAFATLNNAGMGRFADFRNVHSSAGDPEAHQNAGFPPWHRAYLLDLVEALRLLAADPSAKDLLVRILAGRNEKPDVKMAAAVALQSLDPGEFERQARRIVLDDDENDQLRALALNALTYFGNPTVRAEDDELARESKV